MAALPILYTIGYQQRSIEEYVHLLRRARIEALVDVRETAWSHKPGFSKTAMERRLGAVGVTYIHAGFAGNPKFLRLAAPSHEDCLRLYATFLDGHPEIVEGFSDLIAPLIGAGRRVCITCFERHPDDCHRGILAHRWQARGNRLIKHLNTAGCERITRPSRQSKG